MSSPFLNTSILHFSSARKESTLASIAEKSATTYLYPGFGTNAVLISSDKTVLRPAFQMAVDDDLIVKNPFGFQLAGVIYNDEKTRQAITKEQMKKFLKFVHDDNIYCKYYEVFYILFHTGMRISEFCGLTLKDVDMKIWNMFTHMQ